MSQTSALQHTATHCSTLQHTAAHCSILQHTATHCSTLQHTAAHCSTLQHNAAHCSTLQHTAPHCNTLQHTATHCNKLLSFNFSNIMPILILLFRSEPTFMSFYNMSRFIQVVVTRLPVEKSHQINILKSRFTTAFT